MLASLAAVLAAGDLIGRSSGPLRGGGRALAPAYSGSLSNSRPATISITYRVGEELKARSVVDLSAARTSPIVRNPVALPDRRVPAEVQVGQGRPPAPARETRRWRELYYGRSAVEPEFGRLKHEHGLAPLRTRNLARVHYTPTS